MVNSIEVHKTYKYRLYRSDKKDHKLRHKIFVASTIWNHLISLQRRYYRLTKKYISLHDMNKHILKLRKTQRFYVWRALYSQVCQDVCWRVDNAYQRFFNHLAKGRPNFKKVKKYKSFTFPQSGYKLLQFNQNALKANGKYTRVRATIRIDDVKYHFVQHRPLYGKIKILTIKRDNLDRLWLFFTVVEQLQIEQSSTGKSGGFDFGLKTFLTDNEGRSYISPEFFTQGIRKTRNLNRQLSRKLEGSRHYNRAKHALSKHSTEMTNKRSDHHFKLAHRLCDEYSILYFKDLTLSGMKALWGRKVSDLGFGNFISILQWVALKRNKTIIMIDRFTPTTKICSRCGQRHNLTLHDRVLSCDCGLVINRDHNAAINILCAGASAPYQSVHKS